MDIAYLLFLQNFRNSIHDAWTPFLEGLSFFAISYLFLVPVFIYWCINKRKGLFTLTAMFACQAVAATVKLTACAYRPWIRDARILPAGNAITTATGYSFPSGHSTLATTMYGGTAVGFWENKKTRWISCICVLAILLTGFSRNYLGVHTPQDVVVGITLGVLALWATHWLFAYLTKHPEKENKWLLSGFILGLLALVYITYKPYPMDYINGKLLVDPQAMMNDTFKDIGAFLGFCVGRYIEKRWIRFTSVGFTIKGILFTLVGLGILVYLAGHIFQPAITWLGPHWGRLCAQSFLAVYVVALYPLLLKWLANSRNNA